MDLERRRLFRNMAAGVSLGSFAGCISIYQACNLQNRIKLEKDEILEIQETEIYLEGRNLALEYEERRILEPIKEGERVDIEEELSPESAAPDFEIYPEEKYVTLQFDEPVRHCIE